MRQVVADGYFIEVEAQVIIDLFDNRLDSFLIPVLPVCSVYQNEVKESKRIGIGDVDVVNRVGEEKDIDRGFVCNTSFKSPGSRLVSPSVATTSNTTGRFPDPSPSFSHEVKELLKTGRFGLASLT